MERYSIVPGEGFVFGIATLKNLWLRLPFFKPRPKMLATEKVILKDGQGISLWEWKPGQEHLPEKERQTRGDLELSNWARGKCGAILWDGYRHGTTGMLNEVVGMPIWDFPDGDVRVKVDYSQKTLLLTVYYDPTLNSLRFEKEVFNYDDD